MQVVEGERIENELNVEETEETIVVKHQNKVSSIASGSEELRLANAMGQLQRLKELHQDLLKLPVPVLPSSVKKHCNTVRAQILAVRIREQSRNRSYTRAQTHRRPFLTGKITKDSVAEKSAGRLDGYRTETATSRTRNLRQLFVHTPKTNPQPMFRGSMALLRLLSQKKPQFQRMLFLPISNRLRSRRGTATTPVGSEGPFAVLDSFSVERRAVTPIRKARVLLSHKAWQRTCEVYAHPFESPPRFSRKHSTPTQTYRSHPSLLSFSGINSTVLGRHHQE